MPTTDGLPSTEEFLRDPRSYFERGRELSRKQADLILTDGIRKRAERLLPSRTDHFARLVSLIALAGALVSVGVTVISVLVSR